MPARLVRTMTLKEHRTRPISKNSQKLSPASTHTDDSTDNDLPIQMPPANPTSKITLIHLLRQLQTKLRYGADTLLTALMLLKQIGSLPVGQERLIATALIVMAGKVHEYRTPQYSDFSLWANFSFSREELVQTEGNLLILLGFKIPAVLNCRSLQEVAEAIAKC